MSTYEEWEEEQFELGNLYISTSIKSNCVGDLVGLWKRKYSYKKSGSKRNNIGFYLSFEEYLYKAYEARLNDPNQISVKGDSNKTYNLSRYKDLGGYTIENCRFITHLENRVEKLEHYSQSEEMKRRVQNGTHSFIGLAKRRVQNGTHHFLNTPPWKASSTTKKSLKVWYKAHLCHTFWRDNKVEGTKLQKKFDFKSSKACQNIIKKFKEGWIPSEDKTWLEFKGKEGFK